MAVGPKSNICEHRGRCGFRFLLPTLLRVIWTMGVWAVFVVYLLSFSRGIHNPERGLAYTVPPRLLLEKVLRCPEANRLLIYYRDEQIGQGTWAVRPQREVGTSGAGGMGPMRARLTFVLHETVLGLAEEAVRVELSMVLDADRKPSSIHGLIQAEDVWWRGTYSAGAERVETAWGVGDQEAGRAEPQLSEGMGLLGPMFPGMRLDGLAAIFGRLPVDGGYVLRGAEGAVELAGASVPGYMLLVESPNATNPLVRVWIGRSGEILRITTALGLRVENAGLVSYATTAEKARLGGDAE
ncbi:MAG TPA: hypothetical protein DEW46_12145 [Verrucomicrobia bacterium]|mgnify:FL=1|nr:hypothetical protein [Verrucomicrobiota bacterium]